MEEPLRDALYDWLAQNIEAPVDSTSVISFILVLLLAWYIINWTLKFLFAIFWPILLAICFYLMIPLIREGTIERIIPATFEAGKEVFMIIANLISQGLDLLRSMYRNPR